MQGTLTLTLTLTIPQPLRPWGHVQVSSAEAAARRLQAAADAERARAEEAARMVQQAEARLEEVGCVCFLGWCCVWSCWWWGGWGGVWGGGGGGRGPGSSSLCRVP